MRLRVLIFMGFFMFVVTLFSQLSVLYSEKLSRKYGEQNLVEETI